MNEQIQIKFTVSEQIKEILTTNASALGLPVASYVRYIVIKEVEDDLYPSFKMSKRTERRVKEAKKDYINAKVVKNIDKFFNEL